jgi:hypothetical protein
MGSLCVRTASIVFGRGRLLVLLINAGIRKRSSNRDLRLPFILDAHRFNLLLGEKRLESVPDLPFLCFTFKRTATNERFVFECKGCPPRKPLTPLR